MSYLKEIENHLISLPSNEAEIDKVNLEFFKNINLWLLSGEYIIDNHNNKDPFKGLNTALSRLSDTIQSANNSLFQGDVKLTNEILECQKKINWITGKADNLLRSIKNRIVSDSDKNELIDSVELDHLHQDEYGEDEDCCVFFINLKVTYYDHFFDPSLDSIDSLYELYRKIKGIAKRANSTSQQEEKAYLQFILKKCGFLIAKILLRVKKEGDINIPIAFRTSLASDSSINTSYLSEFVQETDVELKSKIELIENHYEINKELEWRRYITEECKETSEKSLAKCTLSDLHRRIKFHKDVSGSYSDIRELELIFHEIESRLKKTKNNPLEKHSLIICASYAINNWFSLFVGFSSVHEFSKVRTFYYKVSSFHEKWSNKNFFPEFKLTRHYVELIERQFTENGAEIPFSQIVEIGDFIKSDVFNKYKQNLQWTKDNYNYVYQLYGADCKFKVNVVNEPFPLYIHSSFILPLPSLKNFKEFESDFLKLNAYYAIAYPLSKSQDVEKIVENELKKREIRSIEIIGIFSALIAFLVGSISGFSFIKSAYQAFIFTLSLSSTLILFILVLLLSTSAEKNRSYYTRSLIVFAISSFVFWLLLIRYRPGMSIFNGFPF